VAGEILSKKALILDSSTNLSKYFPIARLTAAFSEGRAESDDAAAPFGNREYDPVLCVGCMNKPGVHRHGRVSRDMRRNSHEGISLPEVGAWLFSKSLIPVDSL
jgi:hypothetical protein